MIRRNLFVAKDGKDKFKGSFKEPWQSLSYAVSQLHPGDTLFLREGTYDTANDVIDSQRFLVPSGTDFKDGAIRIVGYPNEDVILIPPSGIAPIRLIKGVHHLIFENFEIDGRNQPDQHNEIELIYCAQGAHHCRFARLIVGNCMANAIQWSTIQTDGRYEIFSSYHELIGCTIHHAGLGTYDSGHGGPGINNGYGIYLFTDRNLLLRNRFLDNCGFAINGYGSDNLYDGNILLNNGTRGGSNAAINIGSSAYTYDHGVQSLRNKLHNNVVCKNGDTGVQIYTDAVDTEVINNTIALNGGAGLMLQYNGPADVVNNIGWANGEALADYSGNSIFENNLTEDPRFVDVDNDDYHLKSDSPAIDTGQNLLDHDADLNKRTGISDIGAYEFQSPTPPPPDNCDCMTDAIAAFLEAVKDCKGRR